MPRTKGALNKNAKTEPKYIVTLRNPFDDDSVSSMTFPTIVDIMKFLSSKGLDVAESTVCNYISGHRPNPPFLNFQKCENENP